MELADEKVELQRKYQAAKQKLEEQISDEQRKEKRLMNDLEDLQQITYHYANRLFNDEDSQMNLRQGMNFVEQVKASVHDEYQAEYRKIKRTIEDETMEYQMKVRKLEEK